MSFGIFMVLLPFMDGKEIVCLQSANKFCYEIAISRVQLSIRPETYFFTWPGGGYCSKHLLNTIVSYSKANGV